MNYPIFFLCLFSPFFFLYIAVFETHRNYRCDKINIEVNEMNISKYIKNHKELKEMDFLTVYKTIIELIKDGRFIAEADV